MGKGRSLPQLAITWVLGNRAVSVALVAMHSERELHENVAAAGWRLQSSGELERQDTLRVRPEDRLLFLIGQPREAKHDGG